MYRVIQAFVFLFSVLSLQASDISLFAGWNDLNSVTTVGEKVNFDNFNVLGIRYGKDFFVVLGFENTLAFTPSSALTRTADATGEDDEGLYYAGNVVLNLPIRRLLTFVTFGLGFVHKFGESLPNIGTNFATNWGGGFKVRRLAGPVGLRLDYRRFTVHHVLEEGERVETNELSAGVMFTFGD